MKIPHLTHPERSEFYPVIREALQVAVGRWPVTMKLRKKGGYAASATVRIANVTEKEFDTDRELRDLTRFPARVRAAVTALRDGGCAGSFKISHEDGTLTIVPV